jgi:uncharacterized protein (DUF58 family)
MRTSASHAAPESDLKDLLDEVRRIDVLSRRLVTDVMAGSYHSVFRGAGLEFDRVREYEEGDDPRKVDWNVTARMGRPFVKTHVDEREQTVLFVLDLSTSMDAGLGRWSARQAAARVVACLALTAARNDDKVGLVAFDRHVVRFVPATKGLGHVLRIVRDALALPAATTGTDCAPALEYVSRVARRHAVVVLVSDFLSHGFEHALTLCARRHDVVAVRVTAAEFDAPPSGLVRVRDPETGRAAVVDFDSPAVRASYAQRVLAWRARTEAELRRAKVDLMDVRVPFDPDKNAIARPLLHFFRMRALRGAKR